MSTTSLLFRAHSASGGNIKDAIDFLKQIGTSDAKGAAYVLWRMRRRTCGATDFTMGRYGSVSAVIPSVVIDVIAPDGSVTLDKDWPAGERLTWYELEAYRRARHPFAERLRAHVGDRIVLAPAIGGSVPALRQVS
jgi:hypothetical protein